MESIPLHQRPRPGRQAAESSRGCSSRQPAGLALSVRTNVAFGDTSSLALALVLDSKQQSGLGSAPGESGHPQGEIACPALADARPIPGSEARRRASPALIEPTVGSQPSRCWRSPS